MSAILAHFYGIALMFLFCFVFFHCASWSAELWQQNRSLVFQGHGVALQARTMLLDEGHERLYIGAKNALFSLSLDQINTDQTEVGLLPAVRKYVVNSHSFFMWVSTTTVVFPGQIQWASTESQIEECLMKGREKVRIPLMYQGRLCAFWFLYRV